MEAAITSFFSLQAIIFSVLIYIFCQAFRTSIEKTIGKLKLSFISDHNKLHITDFWKEMFLPTFPLIVGGIGAWLLPQYPYPEIFAATLTARIVFGVIAGWLSGYTYKVARFYIRKNLSPDMKKKFAGMMGEENKELEAELNEEEPKKDISNPCAKEEPKV